MDVVTYALCKKLAKDSSSSIVVSSQEELEQYIIDHADSLKAGQIFFVLQPETSQYLWDGSELKPITGQYSLEDIIEVFYYLFNEELEFMANNDYIYFNDDILPIYNTSWG